MNRMANPRLQAALLRAQRKRRQRADGRTLLRLYVASLPRSLADWLAFLLASAFTVLCLIPAAQLLAWLGRMVGW